MRTEAPPVPSTTRCTRRRRELVTPARRFTLGSTSATAFNRQHRQLERRCLCDRRVPADPASRSLYRGHRYPSEIIAHAVWLYFRFSLAGATSRSSWPRGAWPCPTRHPESGCARFGAAYALVLRRRRPRRSDKWYLDEVQLKIKGKRGWLWRAVDKHGAVLEILVHQRRDQYAAEMFLRRVIASTGSEPRSGNHPALSHPLAHCVVYAESGLPTAQRINNRARTHTSRRVNVSESCAGSSRPSMPSDS